MRSLRDVEPFKCGSFMWNLMWSLEEPGPLCGTWNLFRVEPLSGTVENLVPGFRPQAFQAVGEKT